jgi:hypothetical protein
VSASLRAMLAVCSKSSSADRERTRINEEMKTRYRRSIPRGLSYPLGLEAISSALKGVPQFEELSVTFWCLNPAALLRVPADSDRFLRVVEATFEKISPGCTGSNAGVDAGWYSEKWALHVYPVPSRAKARVRKGLQTSGLPRIRAWLEAPREQAWLYGTHSCVASVRLGDGEVDVENGGSA